MKTRLMITAASAALAVSFSFATLAQDTNIDAGATVDTGVDAATDAAGANASGSAAGDAGATVSEDGVSVETSANAEASTSMTIDEIDVDLPFGDIVVDPSLTPDVVDASLTEEQRMELMDRCELISQNPDRFTMEQVPEFCIAYVDWMKKMEMAQ